MPVARRAIALVPANAFPRLAVLARPNASTSIVGERCSLLTDIRNGVRDALVSGARSVLDVRMTTTTIRAPTISTGVARNESHVASYLWCLTSGLRVMLKSGMIQLLYLHSFMYSLFKVRKPYVHSLRLNNLYRELRFHRYLLLHYSLLHLR